MTININKINEEYLLLLVDKGNKVHFNIVDIGNSFENENEKLTQLSRGGDDNIDRIIQFVLVSLKPKLPNKIFNYCKELDKAYQSVHINIDVSIQEIIKKRDLIYFNQQQALAENKDFDLNAKFIQLKGEIRETIQLWFKVFNIELAYEKAQQVSNLLVYSHRLSG